ncbi:ATP-binding protein [Nonomuraea jabiensis]|uniref:Tetratricopeptide (TPR) repeat protein n=1 Tax=Nonomuraea jabiensis TaxID=882448 RepID=A0A7W9G0W9_9ACTN|nr:tetratricopeptide repeat protein [Nonomuraea jabiensis]MBB5775059.1 tetratricopeptide (TPR) repeat protein [Nonomuraea jabiensis]
MRRKGDEVQASGNAATAVGRDVNAPILTNPVFLMAGIREDDVSAPCPIILPPRIVDFTGRDTEIDIIEALVDDERGTTGTLVISGKPGVGKTALAVHVAYRLLDRFPDGSMYFDLRGVDKEPASTEDIMARIMRALGVSEDGIPTDAAQRLDVYRSLIGRSSLLIILDNAASESQVRPLIPSGNTTLTLVTSRNQLAGLESVLRVDLDDFPLKCSLDLLEKISGRGHGDMSKKSAGDVARYCGYLPLALRIAGNRLYSSSNMRMEDLAKELRDESRRLDSLEIGDLAVRAAFRISYRRLGKSTKRVFKYLSAIPGEDFGVAICSALTGYHEKEAKRSLTRLAEANLIERSEIYGRYRLHDLIKIYSREELLKESSANVATSLTRMFEWVEHSLIRATTTLSGQIQVELPSASGADFDSVDDASEWLRQELSTAVTAMRSLVSDRKHESALLLATTLNMACELTGRWHEWDEVIALGKRLSCDSGDPLSRIIFLAAKANLCRYRREYAEALTSATEAYEVAKALNVKPIIAQVANQLGSLYNETGRQSEGVPLLEKSLSIFRELGLTHYIGEVLYNLGNAHRIAGDPETAIAYYMEDLKICRESGDVWGVGETLNTLAVAYHYTGSLLEAEECQREALEIFQRLGNDDKESMVLIDLGNTLRGQGRHQEALSLCLRAIEITRAINDTSGLGIALSNAADALLHLGRYEEARTMSDDAIATLEPIGDDPRLARSLVGQVPILFNAGHVEFALQRVERAVSILAKFGEIRDIADAYRTVAHECGQIGNHAYALEYVEKALDQGVTSPRFLATCYLIGTVAAVGVEDPNIARRFLAGWRVLASAHPFLEEEMAVSFSQFIDKEHNGDEGA